MGRFLTETAGFSGTPALLGTVERIAPDGTAMALAVLSAYVPNQGDLWSFARDHLRRVPRDRPLPGTEQEEDPHGLFVELMGRLGRQTADLHRALCPDGETDPAFAPEPIAPEDLAAWHETVAEQAEALFDRLERHRAANPDPLLDALLDRREALRARVCAAAVPGIRAVRIRCHGDYHLGQVLVARQGFAIIDFEGEPKRSLPERRTKHTPLKDVASMVRSIHYAAAVASRSASELPTLDRPAFEAMCLDWRDRSVAAFLAGYRESIAGAACWPDDLDAANRLLDLMLIDKVLYEIGYELANRPAWLAIPVQGLNELLTEDGHAARF
jgi:maltose alpha-D-glucosyltransferase/alpha-amylase